MKPEAAKSPSRSPKCCKPTQWRQLNHKGILAENKALPQQATIVDPTKTHDDQEPRTCRSATNQRQHAHAQAPAGTRLAGTPLLFKVRVLKAPRVDSLDPPPLHGHSNLKVEPQTKTTATWRAQSKQADPPTSSLGLTPRSEASAKHEKQPDLPEPEAAKVLQANTVKRETDQREAVAPEHRHKLT